MSSTERPTKRQAFLALLREGWTSLHLDARKRGVIVPASLRGEAHLVLQYGHDLPIPIPDLEVDDYGVRATLSFSRTAHLTVVPWDAVYVVTCDDGRGVLYSEDVPPDVAFITARGGVPGDLLDAQDPNDARDGEDAEMEADDLAADDVVLAPPRVTQLRSVPADSTPVMPDPMVARRRRRARPQLRLVK
jgi:hypothetical protein